MIELEKLYGWEEMSAMMQISVSALRKLHGVGLLKSKRQRPVGCTEKQIQECWKILGTPETIEAIRVYNAGKKTVKRGRPLGSPQHKHISV